ncbi:MAG: glycosyltransferase [Methanobrevibacter sp.]|uniref:glycosyltransferase n=1 Tax=Methanobrevibacter sp. TaxID=66852 RepID=UPI0026DF0D36|nr:glycosyltransferase [Methanobrevibacter sp.]MDO5849408.1 glycosyltransferase [Methanobrevibacter sp.]
MSNEDIYSKLDSIINKSKKESKSDSYKGKDLNSKLDYIIEKSRTRDEAKEQESPEYARVELKTDNVVSDYSSDFSNLNSRLDDVLLKIEDSAPSYDGEIGAIHSKIDSIASLLNDESKLNEISDKLDDRNDLHALESKLNDIIVKLNRPENNFKQERIDDTNIEEFHSKLDKINTIVKKNHNRAAISDINSKLDSIIKTLEDDSKIDDISDKIDSFQHESKIDIINDKLDYLFTAFKEFSNIDNIHEFNSIKKQFNDILADFDNLKLDEINSNLNSIISSLDDIPKTTSKLETINDTLVHKKDLNKIHTKLDNIKSKETETKVNDILDILNKSNSDIDSKLDEIILSVKNDDYLKEINSKLDEIKADSGIEKIDSKLDDAMDLIGNNRRLNNLDVKVDKVLAEISEKPKEIDFDKIDEILAKMENNAQIEDVDSKVDDVLTILNDDSKLSEISSKLDNSFDFDNINSKLEEILKETLNHQDFETIISKLNSVMEAVDEANSINHDSRIDGDKLKHFNSKLDNILLAVKKESREIDLDELEKIESRLDDLVLKLGEIAKNQVSNERFDVLENKLDNVVSNERIDVLENKLDNVVSNERIDVLETKLDEIASNLANVGKEPVSDTLTINRLNELESKIDMVISIVGDDVDLVSASEVETKFTDIESKIDDIILNLTDNTTDLDIDGKLRIISHKLSESIKEEESEEDSEGEIEEKSLNDDKEKIDDDFGFDPESFESEIISAMEKNRPDIVKDEGGETEKAEESKEVTKVEAEIVEEPLKDEEEEPAEDDTALIEDIARSEYTVKEKRYNFDVSSLKGKEISPLILLLTNNDEDEERLNRIMDEMGADVVNFSEESKASDYIKNNDVDLILLDIDSDVDVTTFLDEIVLFNIPTLLIVDLNKDIPDELFNYSYNFIFKPFTNMEVEQTIYVVLIEHTKNHQLILDAKSNIDEKNQELIIEKVESFLLLFLSVTLIVTGIVTFNITFLQWIIFIPSVLMLIIAFVSLKKIKEPEPFEEPPFVSIIIPAHNEEYSIEGTVRCIGDIDYTHNGKKNFELIVCNDGSTDRTGEILKGLKDEIDVLRIVTRKPPQSGKGKGFVLNDAFNLSKGEIIGVFDADTRVHPDFLDKIVPYLNDPTVEGVQSRVKMFNKDENFVTRMQHVEFSCFANTLRARDIMGFNGFLGGNGQFVKRQTIEDVGKWDGFAVTEDLNLSIKMLIEGKRIRFCGEAAIYQEAVNTWKALFKQRTRWASGNFEALFIYTPVILRSKISPLKKLGIIDHISFYAFNLFIFTGFVIFIVNIIAWFVLHQPTFIRMDAPLIIGLISAFAFFPPLIISLTRDKTNVISFIKDLIGYWMYCYHLIPLFFKTMYSMFTRKERTWDKTEHKISECDPDILLEE